MIPDGLRGIHAVWWGDASRRKAHIGGRPTELGASVRAWNDRPLDAVRPPQKAEGFPQIARLDGAGGCG